MRRAFTYSILIGTGFLAAVVLIGRLPAAKGGGGGAVTSLPGDTNGDLELDISDAVYLLLHLFSNGPPPVAIADSPEILGRMDSAESRLAAAEATITAHNGFQTQIEELQSRLMAVEASSLVHDGFQAQIEALRDRTSRISGETIGFVALSSGKYIQTSSVCGPKDYFLEFRSIEGSPLGMVSTGVHIEKEVIAFTTQKKCALIIRLTGHSSAVNSTGFQSIALLNGTGSESSMVMIGLNRFAVRFD